MDTNVHRYIPANSDHVFVHKVTAQCVTPAQDPFIKSADLNNFTLNTSGQVSVIPVDTCDIQIRSMLLKDCDYGLNKSCCRTYVNNASCLRDGVFYDVEVSYTDEWCVEHAECQMVQICGLYHCFNLQLQDK